MKIIDTHAHILRASYENKLLDVIDDINKRKMIVLNVAYNLKTSNEVIKLNSMFPNLIPIIGIHPNDTKNCKGDCILNLEKILNEKVVAIGEIGLDYHYDEYQKEKQKKFFIEQINLAKKYKLPIVVHARDSLEDCYKIIKNYPDQKFLLHSWSGDEEMTKKFLKISNNIFFSYNGIITFKNAKLQQNSIKKIPINRLLIETDCPWLSPIPFRGKTNYPWRVEEVIKFIANLLEMDFKEVNLINNKNTFTFFELK